MTVIFAYTSYSKYGFYVIIAYLHTLLTPVQILINGLISNNANIL